MRLIPRRPGSRYDGPVAYTHDYALVRRPGYYALSADGKKLLWPRLRVVAVDDAPGDPEDGAFHYEIAGRRDPVARAGAPVALEAHAHGEGVIESP